jgi:uncharacterized membrane protein
MLPDPLHPAVVHFPIVLMYIAPIVVVWAAWRARRSEFPMRTWLIVPVFFGAIVVSGFVAKQTGNDGEELAEEFVDHDVIETHEERGEQFVLFALGAFIVSIAGFASGKAGQALKGLTLIAALTGVVLITRVGHSGGTMVYDHMVGQAGTDQAGAADFERRTDRDDDDRDD